MTTTYQTLYHTYMDSEFDFANLSDSDIEMLCKQAMAEGFASSIGKKRGKYISKKSALFQQASEIFGNMYLNNPDLAWIAAGVVDIPRLDNETVETHADRLRLARNARLRTRYALAKLTAYKIACDLDRFVDGIADKKHLTKLTLALEAELREAQAQGIAICVPFRGQIDFEYDVIVAWERYIQTGDISLYKIPLVTEFVESLSDEDLERCYLILLSMVPVEFRNEIRRY